MRIRSPASVPCKHSDDPQNIDKKFPGVARNIRNCATTTLVGGWKRATIPTSSPGGCHNFEHFRQLLGPFYQCFEGHLNFHTVLRPEIWSSPLGQTRLTTLYIRNVHRYKYKKYATIYWFSCISTFLKSIQDIRMVLKLASEHC